MCPLGNAMTFVFNVTSCNDVEGMRAMCPLGNPFVIDL